MKFRSPVIFLMALVFASAAYVQRASAEGVRTWVASYGDDASADCSRAAPCRSFGGAYGKTAAGGEITCADSAGFGSLGITMSITINCLNADGTGASSAGAGSVGVFTVNVSPTDKVTLRGFDVDQVQFGGSLSAIQFIGAGTLILDKVKISNVGGPASGLLFRPTGAGRLVVTDSLFTNNGNGSGAGIRMVPSGSGTVQAMIKNTNVSGNLFGIAIDGGNSTGGINATIIDSVMASNANDGIIATSSPSTAPVGVTVINSQSINNGFGIRSIGSNVTVRVKNSDIIGNGTGLSGGGALLSAGNNLVQANATNGSFTGSVGLQ